MTDLLTCILDLLPLAIAQQPVYYATHPHSCKKYMTCNTFNNSIIHARNTFCLFFGGGFSPRFYIPFSYDHFSSIQNNDELKSPQQRIQYIHSSIETYLQTWGDRFAGFSHM